MLVGNVRYLTALGSMTKSHLSHIFDDAGRYTVPPSQVTRLSGRLTFETYYSLAGSLAAASATGSAAAGASVAAGASL
ncbi:hypothetical protein Poly21_25380 [Allorhodopirellula heiligendammensis]|uniref:Uncharacterized protein n=1 Tax=Allorhodopirellula heiligendammensis TaxID=2714739 RepID=A0A5C6BSY5_9BACT|nr:hypothetical protein Poly21_25380 [Allorhodopirellula heiligendammensis]